MHHDRLGSVAAVTDTLGAVIERFSYEAFGKKRNAATWEALVPGQTVAVNTSEGFTGHEQLEAFGLVHMGGRIYDPVLCRFTSADPVVQAPTNGQSYNRYSYIMNSPINGTDPSGYSWFSDIWDAKVEFFSDAHDSLVETFSDLHDDTNQFIKKNYKVILTIAVIVVIAFVAPIITSALTGVATTAFTTTELVIAGAIGGALSGAATTAIAGGSTSDILKAAAFGAVSGALTAGIGHGIGAFADGAGKYLAKPIVHGLVQGGISEAQGGDFKSAAIGAAAGAFLGGAMEWAGVGVGDKSFGGIVVRTAAAAAVGGTASKLGGGSFANGAITAAFVHLFNAEAAPYWDRLRTKFPDATRAGRGAFLNWGYEDFRSQGSSSHAPASGSGADYHAWAIGNLTAMADAYPAAASTMMEMAQGHYASLQAMLPVSAGYVNITGGGVGPMMFGGYGSLIIDSDLTVHGHGGILWGTPGGFVSVTASRANYSSGISTTVVPFHGVSPAFTFSNSVVPSEAGINFGTRGVTVAIPIK